MLILAIVIVLLLFILIAGISVAASALSGLHFAILLCLRYVSVHLYRIVITAY